jgi:hypothetical protein
MQWNGGDFKGLCDIIILIIVIAVMDYVMHRRVLVSGEGLQNVVNFAVQSSRRVQSYRSEVRVVTFSVTVIRLISPCMRYILRTTDNPCRSNRYSIAFTAHS